MQSHFGRAQTGPNDGQQLRRDPAPLSPGCGLACEQSALLDPVERQIECCQTRRGERDGLPTLQDRLDQIRAQKGEANQASDVAPGDAVTLGQVLQRSDTAGGELVKPRAPARAPSEANQAVELAFQVISAQDAMQREYRWLLGPLARRAGRPTALPS